MMKLLLGLPRYLSSVQLLSRVQLFATPWTAARQASLFITNSQSLLKLMFIESVMPSNHPILHHPLLLLPSIFPSISVFSNETVHHQVAKVLASASVLPMNTQDWFPLGLIGLISLQFKGLSRVFSNTTVQKHQFFSTQLSLWSNSHIRKIIIWKTIALTRHTFVGKVMSLLFNMLSSFIIAFLSRSKYLLISWLQSPSAVIVEPQKVSWSLFLLFPCLFAMKWWDQMPSSSSSECWALSQLFTLHFHFHQEAF